MPSICVFGAGAIGGLVAAKLEAAGTPVSVVARGAHLTAMRQDGLVLHTGGERVVTRPNAVAHGDAIGPQDYLLITLKAHSLEPALPQLAPLVGPGTTIVAAVNGMPWWYTYGLPAPFTDRPVTAVDPAGALWAALPPAQCLGCIIYPAATVTAPGVIDHTYGDRFSLGEPDGQRTERANTLSTLLIAAGMKAPVRPRIRDELWVKLWGNMAFNPLSALTTATLDVITGDPGSRGVARAMMLEKGRPSAEAHGHPLRAGGGQADRGCGGGRPAQDFDAAGPGTRPAAGDRGAAGVRRGVGRLGRSRRADQQRRPRSGPAARGLTR